MRDQEELLDKIRAERERQDLKFGVQNHDDGRWALIFLEEVGEAARDILEERDPEEEMVQVAAVTLAWMEARRRRERRG